MEGRVEYCEPEIRGRHGHVESGKEYPEDVPLLKVLNCICSNLYHVLMNEVPHEDVAEGELEDALDAIADTDGWRSRIGVLIAASRGE